MLTKEEFEKELQEVRSRKFAYIANYHGNKKAIKLIAHYKQLSFFEIYTETQKYYAREKIVDYSINNQTCCINSMKHE